MSGRADKDDDNEPALTIDSLDADPAGATIAAGEQRWSHIRETNSDSPPAESFGRLVLRQKLGDGGMGTVYRAFDPLLARDVAVKVIHPGASDEKGTRAQFLAESQVTAQLEHPNIVPVYDLGATEDGTPYLVMKEIRGRSLREVLDALADGDEETAAQWTRHRLLTAFLTVCQAVAYAHEKGVLHRDLKPGNIMLGEFGEVLVLDWGVARRIRRDGKRRSDHPEPGPVVGTPGYMSPEQVLGKKKEVDPRTDVWSLGAILYEIITCEPAYRGECAFELMQQAVNKRPTAPALRAPHADIPKELADACYQAMDPKPGDRYRTAAALGDTVESFLEGTRRRQEASKHVEQARAHWRLYEALGEEREDLRAAEKRHADAADAWAPLSEKQELLATRAKLDALAPRRAKIFGEVIALCEKALAHDPDHAEARTALARAYWSRVEDAEAQRDAAGVAYYCDRVSTYDGGEFSDRLEGGGSLTVHTEPPGAEVFCQRFDDHGLVLPLDEGRVLGRPPFDELALEMGSYLLTLRHPDKRDTPYPVHITRCRHWTTGHDALPLHDDATIGADFVYVPAGPALLGGDPEAPGSGALLTKWIQGFFLARFPVSMEDYVEFLNAIAKTDPAQAWRHCPRSEAGLSASEGQYLKKPRRGEPYQLPSVDADGNDWDPAWPVFGVSWNDGVAYARWRSERDGLTYRLPFEEELEKASRGVDGRFYPWGNGFDRTLCKMGDSRRERARPEPIGAFKTDTSVYGVRDLAGSMRDWCADEQFDGDATLRPVRGGSWNYDPRFCRAACRLGRPPWRVFAYNGFRLARSSEP